MADTATTAHVDLGVTGMTCTSCSSRVQRKLNKLDGVEAAVNFATESAAVDYDPHAVDVPRLIEVVRNAGYDAFDFQDQATQPGAETETPDAWGALDTARAEESRDLLRRVGWSAALSVPVMCLSMIPALQFTHWQWACAILTSLVYVFDGAPFHRAAWTNLAHGSFTMDTLVSLGTTAAYFWSLGALFFTPAGDPGAHMVMSLSALGHTAHGTPHIYFEAVGMVITFILVGRWCENRAKGQSLAALRELMSLRPQQASVLRGGTEERIPASELRRGDIFVVRPGEKIATDGVVTAGHSAVDESLLSGEAVPVEVGEGASVTGATINTTGRIEVRVTRVGTETTLAQMAKLVADAQSKQAPVQRLVDRVAQVFVPAVVVIAAVTLVAHLLAGHSVGTAFIAAVAVLIIACPCAMGLATPTAILVGTGRGAQLGLLISGADVLESTRTVDTVVLDKTGTVTEGAMSVHAATDTESLRLAAAVEAGSEHPIARAIVAAAGETSPATDVTAEPGVGVSGQVDGHRVQVGRPRADVPLPAELRRAVDAAETAVVVAVDGAPRGVIDVRDSVKESSREAVSRLRGLGLEPHLLTGDNERVARAVADAVGIDTVTAGVMPEDKAAVIDKLQAAGHTVAMVGDGVNDAPALAQADLGVAMSSGADVAIAAADITLMGNDLHQAADAVRLSRRTLQIIKGNLWWAFAYNALLIPVAACGLLNPLFAGLAMALSSVFVVTNSLRLRSFQPSAS